jgi:hypothetical protein
MIMTTAKQVRAAFWQDNAHLVKVTKRGGAPAPQNMQPTDTRAAFVDYVDNLARAQRISEQLAQRVTL